MAHPKPYPRCIFCGEKANSREHAIPKWISKRLGIKTFLPPETAFLRGIARRKQPISFASHRARIFCRGCNRHFKHLEDAVIPLLVPMAKRRVVSLDQDSQALLAQWASKTAVALLAAVPELREVVPIDHRRSIREDGRPSDKVWVAYFPWRDGAVISTAQGEAKSDVHSALRHETYSAILTFAEIGFYVDGFFDPPFPGESIDSDHPPLLQFWPLKHHLIHWPPQAAPITPGDRFRALLNFVPLRGSAKPPNQASDASTEIDQT